jgi:hypothetical protein
VRGCGGAIGWEGVRLRTVDISDDVKKHRKGVNIACAAET